MKNETINIRFPSLNKNCTLSDNDKYIAEENNVSRCTILKTIKVPGSVYKALGDSLMDDNSMWDNIGGVMTEDERYSGLEGAAVFNTWHTDGRPDVWITEVVRVINLDADNDEFYVNTEGYEYARYVGRLA